MEVEQIINLTEAERKLVNSERSICSSPETSHLSNYKKKVFNLDKMLKDIFTFQRHNQDDYQHQLEY